MPIKNDQMFLDAVKEYKKKKSRLNKPGLLKMMMNYTDKQGGKFSPGQKELEKYLGRQK